MKALFSILSAAVAALLAFTHAHPAFVIMAVTSAVAFLHDHLAAFPRLQAVAKLAQACGFDGSRAKAAVIQFLTGVAAVSVFALVLLGCGASAPVALTPAAERAEVRGAVETAESAWLLAAQACVDLAGGLEPDAGTALVEKCGGVMLPARDALIEAAGDVDAWQADAGQAGVANTVACDLQEVSKAFAALQSMGVPLPSVVADAQALAGSLVCSAAPAADGGK